MLESYFSHAGFVYYGDCSSNIKLLKEFKRSILLEAYYCIAAATPCIILLSAILVSILLSALLYCSYYSIYTVILYSNFQLKIRNEQETLLKWKGHMIREAQNNSQFKIKIVKISK